MSSSPRRGVDMGSKTVGKALDRRGWRLVRSRSVIYLLLVVVALLMWTSPRIVMFASGGKQAVLDWLEPPPAPVPTDVERFTCGDSFPGEIRAGRREVWYEFEVPEEAVKVNIQAETFSEVELDLDLFAGSSDEVVPGTNPIRRAHGGADQDRASSISWRDSTGRWTGTFTLRVSTPLPSRFGLPFELESSLGHYRVGPELVAGEWQRVSLGGPTGKSTVFEFDLDEPAESLHVRLDEARVDYDLSLARAGGPETTWTWSSATRFKDETLDVRPESGFQPGRYRLLIADSVSSYSEDSDDDKVLVAISADEPLPYRHPLPGPPEVEFPAIRGLGGNAGACIVHLSVPGAYGSGVVVSPQGHLLSAAHVFDDDEDLDNGVDHERALVGFVDDPSLQPRQSFVAELIDVDPRSDLALARIVRMTREEREGVEGISDRLPVFPFLPLRTDGLPDLGEPVTALGLSGVSSSQERSTLHVTRGIVAGFDGDSHPPRYAMIDAPIFDGMSGGGGPGPGRPGDRPRQPHPHER